METANTTAEASSSSSRDKLVSDLKLVIKDAEELLRSTGQQTYQSARARFESTLQTAKTGLGSLHGGGKDILETTDQYVQANPWQSVGIGAVAGLVIGYLLSRK